MDQRHNSQKMKLVQ